MVLLTSRQWSIHVQVLLCNLVNKLLLFHLTILLYHYYGSVVSLYSVPCSAGCHMQAHSSPRQFLCPTPSFFFNKRISNATSCFLAINVKYNLNLISYSLMTRSKIFSLILCYLVLMFSFIFISFLQFLICYKSDETHIVHVKILEVCFRSYAM